MKFICGISLVTIMLPNAAFAQYQKTINTNTLNMSGFENYYNLAYARQLRKKDSLLLRLSYYEDNQDIASNMNYVADLSYLHTFLRVMDVYLNAGAGLFFMHTRAEDIIGNSDNDNSSGLAGSIDLEYYLSHRFILFGAVRQLLFLNSDFYNRQPLYGVGFKIVF